MSTDTVVIASAECAMCGRPGALSVEGSELIGEPCCTRCAGQLTDGGGRPSFERGYRLPASDALALVEVGATVWDTYEGSAYSFVVGELVGLSAESVTVRIAGSSATVDLPRRGGSWSAAPFVSAAGICAPGTSGRSLTTDVRTPSVVGMAATPCTHRTETLVPRTRTSMATVVTLCGAASIGSDNGWTTGPRCAEHADEFTELT